MSGNHQIVNVLAVFLAGPNGHYSVGQACDRVVQSHHVWFSELLHNCCFLATPVVFPERDLRRARVIPEAGQRGQLSQVITRITCWLSYLTLSFICHWMFEYLIDGNWAVKIWDRLLLSQTDTGWNGSYSSLWAVEGPGEVLFWCKSSPVVFLTH